MDEKVVEEIRMHQETVATEANSPLHRIREKELEFSGRVLSAKREADEALATARKKAAEIAAAAEAEGGSGAADREREILADAEAEAKLLREAAAVEAHTLSEQIETRRDEAVRLVLEAVASS